jgi:hypothetical protein
MTPLLIDLTIIKELTGICNSIPVISPGEYFFIIIVAIRCGNIVLIIIVPRNPKYKYLKNNTLGKNINILVLKYAIRVITNTAK